MASLGLRRITSAIGIGLFLDAIVVSLILPLIVFTAH